MATHNPQRGRLEKAIRSIISQTEKDFEFIIVNDGSDSDRSEMISTLSELDKRIRLINNTKSNGLANALNIGIAVADGELIARMDDDDISLPNRFETQIRYLKSHPQIYFVGSNVYRFDGRHVLNETKLPEFPERKSFLWTSPFIHPTVMFRKEALMAVDGYKVAKVTQRAEDYDLFMRLFAAGFMGANIQKPLFKYYEDVNKRKRNQSYRIRFDEFIIRKVGFKSMKLPWYRIFFMLKPLIVGLIPHRIIFAIHGHDN